MATVVDAGVAVVAAAAAVHVAPLEWVDAADATALVFTTTPNKSTQNMSTMGVHERMVRQKNKPNQLDGRQ